MRRRICGLVAAGFSVAVVVTACSSSGAGGRPVDIAQADDGCTPTVITATPGEKLKLVVHNTSGKDYEVEGIDGTKLEELVIPCGAAAGRFCREPRSHCFSSRRLSLRVPSVRGSSVPGHRAAPRIFW